MTNKKTNKKEEPLMTTIKLKKTNKKVFRECAVHPRETDEDVVMRLVEKDKANRKEQKE